MNAGDIQTHASIGDWIAAESIGFSLDDSATFNAAVDQLMVALGSDIDLLGFGETLHGGEEQLVLRNRLFKRLAKAHGFSAIAVESSYPKARVAQRYVEGDTNLTIAEVMSSGFSYGFGELEANRRLIEWLRAHNDQSSDERRLRFYGFDSPTESTSAESPRLILNLVMDYLDDAGIDCSARRARIEQLIGADNDWEDPDSVLDASASIGRSDHTVALSVEVQELLTDLRIQRPALLASTGPERFSQAMHDGWMARQLLSFHAALAMEDVDRLARILGLRDAIMAETIAHIVATEQPRGRVLIFAHNGHLQRRMTDNDYGDTISRYWPAGAHLEAMFGSRYAYIASAAGSSPDNGMSEAEPGTFEAILTSNGGPYFIPTHRGAGLPLDEIASMSARSKSQTNPSYLPLIVDDIQSASAVAVFSTLTRARTSVSEIS